MEQIQLGKQDLIFAGGGEELHWTLSCLFDAMGALSNRYNDTPEKASRAYDTNRDGFVIAGGGGMLVVEELEHARSRGAKIYAELYSLLGKVADPKKLGPFDMVVNIAGQLGEATRLQQRMDQIRKTTNDKPNAEQRQRLLPTERPRL